MRKMFTIVALFAGILALTATAATAKPGKNEAKKAAKAQCLAEKKADKAAFKATYGKRAMRTCVKGEKADESAEAKNAAKECKAERDADEEAFNAEYGTGKKGKNALGKCVSSKSKEIDEAEAEAFKNAAKECRDERSADRDAFKETYGSNKNKKNAFGKCVSGKVKDAENEVPEEPADES